MKPCFAAMLLAGLLGSGCVVQSLRPWLSDDSRVTEPSLLGSWHDADNGVIAFFTESTSAECDYAVTLSGPKDIARFTATLHRLDDTLLLVVGPEPRTDAGVYATHPAYLLFKAVVAGDALALQAVSLDAFAEHAGDWQIPLLPDGSKSGGFVLTGSTDTNEAFVRARMADPDFFDAKPLYSFRKLPLTAAPDAPAP